MKNLSASVKGLIFSLLAMGFAFAIYFLFLAKPNYYLVDNPTPDTYYFKINNGEEKILSAGQYLKVDLEKGKNSIKVFDQNKKMLYDSAFTVEKVRGLLNITNKDYYINNQYYGYGVNKDSLIAATKGIDIDNKHYLGDVKKTNKLYNEDFYYNLDEEYDRIVKNVAKTESRTKIFRKQDFINYYKNYYKL
ncbi:hypothetical protein [Epilithonimonas hungarica]|uniref:Uncharacterized protein n=1 Tax=Epilithonimonas hungarica TaxID=454006 RepID=A0A1G7LUH2_9FLAO|nr:hypothetical protein [Epilithonimonas hungarica]SDF53152.1 hypothetical protein SAMN05421825_1604 [Epilithonimonas hungarica]